MEGSSGHVNQKIHILITLHMVRLLDEAMLNSMRNKEMHDNDWGDVSLGETLIKSYIDRYMQKTISNLTMIWIGCSGMRCGHQIRDYLNWRSRQTTQSSS